MANKSNGGYNLFAGKVYFVADLEIHDEELDDADKSAYTYGDGIDITAIDE